MKRRLISIVLPAYNESENIPHIIKQIDAHFPFDRFDLEYLFIDDGSIDNTLEVLNRLSKEMDNLFFIEFSRNFGHQCAVKAGIDLAKGDCVISMDCDLQHPPHNLDALIKKWEEGYDVVYTRRSENRTTSSIKRISSNAFYNLINWLTDTKLEKGTADFRLMDRKVVDVFSTFNENDIFIRGLIGWIGFKQIGIDYEPDLRHSGDSKYTIRKMLRLAFSGITSLSVRPLHLAVYMGFIISLLSFIYLPYVIYSYFFSGHYTYGWGSVILTISFFSGIQLIVLGIIGIYIGKMFLQVKERPLYIIKNTNIKK